MSHRSAVVAASIAGALEIVDYLRNLPRLWGDSGPSGGQALAVAIFSRLEVLGFRQMEFELTLDAVELGMDAAVQGAIELGPRVGEFGRGERI